MFYVVTINGDPSTRLVFGCVGPAIEAAGILEIAGNSISAETVEAAPERDNSELRRAERYVELIFRQAGGRA
jgi:hypothetical protein